MLTEARRKMNGGRLIGELGGNCGTLFFFTFSYLFWWTDSVLSLLSDGEEASQGPKHVSAASYSFPVSVLFLLLRHPAMKALASTHIYTLAFTHKHTQRTSGYAYYMSPPPLKASLLFSFCNLEQGWWGGSQILHLRAVSFLYCRNQKLLFMGKLWLEYPVCCSLKHQYVIQ